MYGYLAKHCDFTGNFLVYISNSATDKDFDHIALLCVTYVVVFLLVRQGCICLILLDCTLLRFGE